MNLNEKAEHGSRVRGYLAVLMLALSFSCAVFFFANEQTAVRYIRFGSLGAHSIHTAAETALADPAQQGTPAHFTPASAAVMQIRRCSLNLSGFPTIIPIFKKAECISRLSAMAAANRSTHFSALRPSAICTS
ncbi:MAG TPA: hypothetical protein DDX71_04830 [Ruminococcus sp.]|nr:hypothetical protein [Ruminococcus sp.]